MDATQNHGAPLTAERLHAWHGALFPTGRSGLKRIRTAAWRDDGVDVYGYFNNDWEGFAVKNGLRLKELLGV